MANHYQRPGWFTKHVFNRIVAGLSRAELPDEEKLPLLRAYLKRWAWEVGAFFQGVGADAPDHELRRIAPLHPVFRISGGHNKVSR
jgi:hypothetical protein